MTAFTYRATGTEGKVVKGTIDAASAAAASALLARKGLRAERVREKRSFLHMELTPQRVSRQELLHFTRQLSAFAGAGVPLIRALESIAAETKNERFTRIQRELAEAIRSGDPIVGAMSRDTDVFPTFFLTLVRAAERTGDLAGALDEAAEYLERDLEARRSLIEALTYPVIVLALALLTVGILAGFVLPRFTSLFESLSADLPLPTRVLLALSDIVGRWWVVGMVMLFLVPALLVLAARTDPGQRRLHALLLRIPVVGELVRMAIVERFCRALGSMTHNGVPLPEGLAIATDTTRNRVFRDRLGEVRAEMLRGEGLAGPMARADILPALAQQMIAVGEETGTLDAQLIGSAEFYGREVRHKLKTLTTLVEPIVIITVGLIVGFIAFSLVSAMYGLITAVRTG